MEQKGKEGPCEDKNSLPPPTLLVLYSPPQFLYIYIYISVFLLPFETLSPKSFYTYTGSLWSRDIVRRSKIEANLPSQMPKVEKRMMRASVKTDRHTYEKYISGQVYNQFQRSRRDEENARGREQSALRGQTRPLSPRSVNPILEETMLKRRNESAREERSETRDGAGGLRERKVGAEERRRVYLNGKEVATARGGGAGRREEEGRVKGARKVHGTFE